MTDNKLDLNDMKVGTEAGMSAGSSAAQAAGSSAAQGAGSSGAQAASQNSGQGAGPSVAQAAAQAAGANAGQAAAQNAGANTAKVAQNQEPKKKPPKKQIPTYFGNKRFMMNYRKKTWMLVLGILLIMGSVSNIVEDFALMVANKNLTLISNIVMGFALIAVAIYLLVTYHENLTKFGRYAKLINVNMGMIPIENLAYLYPTTYEQAVKDLQRMIDKKVLPGAFLDRGNGYLVLNPKNPNVEELINGAPGETGHQAGAKQGAGATAKNGDATENPFSSSKWVDLSRSASKIKDTDIKLRLDRINATMESIRKKGKNDKKLQKNYDIQLFVDFYMPKIVDLLDKYQSLDSISDDMKKSRLKKDLIDTLDSLDSASMNLWSKIVDSDVVNISTELDALNKKLVIDGLSEPDFAAQGPGAKAKPERPGNETPSA